MSKVLLVLNARILFGCFLLLGVVATAVVLRGSTWLYTHESLLTSSEPLGCQGPNSGKYMQAKHFSAVLYHPGPPKCFDKKLPLRKEWAVGWTQVSALSTTERRIRLAWVSADCPSGHWTLITDTAITGTRSSASLRPSV